MSRKLVFNTVLQKLILKEQNLLLLHFKVNDGMQVKVKLKENSNFGGESSEKTRRPSHRLNQSMAESKRGGERDRKREKEKESR